MPMIDIYAPAGIFPDIHRLASAAAAAAMAIERADIPMFQQTSERRLVAKSPEWRQYGVQRRIRAGASFRLTSVRLSFCPNDHPKQTRPQIRRALFYDSGSSCSLASA